MSSRAEGLEQLRQFYYTREAAEAILDGVDPTVAASLYPSAFDLWLKGGEELKFQSVARVALWPFVVAGKALYECGRFVGYIFLASNPLTLAIWMIVHVDHHKDIEEDE